MQVASFPDGSAVAHKIRHIAGSPCRFSAWYASNGHVRDAVRIDSLGREYRPTPRQMRALHMRGGAVFAVLQARGG